MKSSYDLCNKYTVHCFFLVDLCQFDNSHKFQTLKLLTGWQCDCYNRSIKTKKTKSVSNIRLVSFKLEQWLQSFINIYYIANHKVLNSLRVSFISSGIVMITMMVGSCYRYSSIAHISYWTLSINESKHVRAFMNLKYQCCCSAFVFESYVTYSTTIDFFALTTQTSMY